MAEPSNIYNFPRGPSTAFSGGSGGDGGDMSGGPTWKDIIDAGDERTRAQNDARFAEVLAGLDKVNSSLSAFGDTVKTRLDTIDGDLKSAKESARRAEDAARGTRWNIIVTGVTVAGVFLAAWAIWVQGMELVAGLGSLPRP